MKYYLSNYIEYILIQIYMLHIETIYAPPKPEVRYNWEYMAGSYDLQESETNTTEFDEYDNSFSNINPPKHCRNLNPNVEYQSPPNIDEYQSVTDVDYCQLNNAYLPLTLTESNVPIFAIDPMVSTDPMLLTDPPLYQMNTKHPMNLNTVTKGTMIHDTVRNNVTHMNKFPADIKKYNTYSLQCKNNIFNINNPKRETYIHAHNTNYNKKTKDIRKDSVNRNTKNSMYVNSMYVNGKILTIPRKKILTIRSNRLKLFIVDKRRLLKKIRKME